jgi:hypothetical protein
MRRRCPAAADRERARYRGGGPNALKPYISCKPTLVLSWFRVPSDSPRW